MSNESKIIREGEEFNEIVDSAMPNNQGTISTNKNVCPLWIRHGMYYFSINCWRFIFGPKKIKEPTQRDSRFKFVAEQLISTLPDNAKPFIINTSEKLLSQHRTIENTEARRRLERWACWTIIVYLISVFLLVVLNGLSRIIWPKIFVQEGFISDSVLYVILSTTTINIIGLGLIVLKGHFPQESENKKKKKLHKTIKKNTK